MFPSRIQIRVLGVAFAFFCSIPTLGQTAFGPPSGATITGTVRNAGGDPMPGATVTVINQETSRST